MGLGSVPANGREASESPKPFRTAHLLSSVSQLYMHMVTMCAPKVQFGSEKDQFSYRKISFS